MNHFNLKHIKVIKNSNGISSSNVINNKKQEEFDEYIVDLCNGFYLLPQKVPTTNIKINPRIFKATIDKLNKDSEQDILDYITSLLTIVSIFYDKSKADVFGGNIKNTIFSLEELNTSDNQNPYVLFSYKNYINFRLLISDYIKNIDDNTFSIFVRISFEDKNIKVSKQKHILSLFDFILCPPNFNNVFNFKCS
jgi:hypothetical protein